MKQFVFPSKILLFGEHIIVKNYSGLSIPYNFYKGYLNFYNNKKIKKQYINSNNDINIYNNFLSSQKTLSKIIDLKQFSEDIKKGIYFHSNIPQQYGVGSSGALVAAIYNRYNKIKKNHTYYYEKQNILYLKNIFSKMESFFHGTSSGIDPLICFLKKPIYLKSSIDIYIKNISYNNFIYYKKGGVFLINSGVPSKTSLMNKIFLKKIKSLKFHKFIKRYFSIQNNKCIESFINRDYHKLLKHVKKLSIYILDNFSPMIPKHFIEIWKKGVLNDIYYFKLCGSGGGGFFLGFTKNYKKSKNFLKKFQTRIILQF